MRLEDREPSPVPVLEIRTIQKRDYKKAVGIAVTGMHFDWYLNSRFLLNIYGYFFWYLELNQATRIYAAYAGDQFAGVLLAKIDGEKSIKLNVAQKAYVRLVELILRLFFKESAGTYEKIRDRQLAHYLTGNHPDGEITFLAADPDCKVKGIGTALLRALESDARGKTLYLLTDDACTYQFYEHRGFERVEEDSIMMHLPKGEVPLKCFIYERTF